MRQLTLFSPAKLNLFLHITGKRADGYHDLQSVFRAIDFGDELHFECDNQAGLVCLTGATHLTADIKDNLIIKAANALAEYAGIQTPATNITLTKRLPTGAGIGGGSSNAATTLIALNQLWQTHLDTDTLINIGAGIGADVPFFIFAHHHCPDAIVTGIGEKLDAIKLPSHRYLLLLPDEHAATANFFAQPNLQKNCACIDELHQKTDQFCHRLSQDFVNVFEPIAVTISPKIAQALSYLQQLEPISNTTARLSGTGSTVFLPIGHEIDDDTLAQWQKNAPCRSVIAHSLK